MSESRACDPAAAISRLAGNVDLYRDVVRNFLSDAADFICQITAAVGAADGATLHRAAHSFKGSAGLCGANRVADVCSQLEEIGLKFDAEKAGDAARRLASEIAVAETELGPYRS